MLNILASGCNDKTLNLNNYCFRIFLLKITNGDITTMKQLLFINNYKINAL